MSGRGNSLYPPIERIADHVVTRSYGSFFTVKERGKFYPPPPLTLSSRSSIWPFLCPHLYWAEYFYVANVVKLIFINLFGILLM